MLYYNITNLKDNYNGMNLIVNNILLPTTTYLFDQYDRSLSDAEGAYLQIIMYKLFDSTKMSYVTNCSKLNNLSRFKIFIYNIIRND